MDSELYYIPGVGGFHPDLLGITKEDMEQQKVFDQVPSLDWLEEAIKEKAKREEGCKWCIPAFMEQTKHMYTTYDYCPKCGKQLKKGEIVLTD